MNQTSKKVNQLVANNYHENTPINQLNDADVCHQRHLTPFIYGYNYR